MNFCALGADRRREERLWEGFEYFIIPWALWLTCSGAQGEGFLFLEFLLCMNEVCLMASRVINALLFDVV